MPTGCTPVLCVRYCGRMADTTQTKTTYEATTNGHTTLVDIGTQSVQCSTAALKRLNTAREKHGDTRTQHEAVTAAILAFAERLEQLDVQPSLYERASKGGK